MVINVGRLKDKDYVYVFNDIAQVVQASHKAGNKNVVKVRFSFTCASGPVQVA